MQDARHFHPRPQARRRLRRATLLATAFGHALDIAAGTKGSAGASQYDHLDGRVASQPRQPVQQALHDRRRQRIHPLRPIEGQCGDAVFYGFEQFGQCVHVSLRSKILCRQQPLETASYDRLGLDPVDQFLAGRDVVE